MRYPVNAYLHFILIHPERFFKGLQPVRIASKIALIKLHIDLIFKMEVLMLKVDD